MTYTKMSDNWLKIMVVLMIAGVLGGFCLPHFVEVIAGGHSSRAMGEALGAQGLVNHVTTATQKPQNGQLALAKLVEAGYFDTLIN